MPYEERGFFPREHLATFCEPGSILGGHPQAGKVPGVEASTGSLGHGLPVGVGFALHGKMTGKDFRTVVLLGDGECDEGTVWEAAMAAAKHRLNRLAVLVDYNKMQCYAATAEVLDLEPFAAKWRSFGFAVREVDGHDVRALRRVLRALPFHGQKPSAIICHTVKGKGIPGMEMNAGWHHKSKISDEELKSLRYELGCAMIGKNNCRLDAGMFKGVWFTRMGFDQLRPPSADIEKATSLYWKLLKRPSSQTA